MICQLNSEVLIDAGYKVDVAGDGEAAWDALQLVKYDLLITDNSMPKVSGITLLKRIYAANMTLPVIMATATMPEFSAYPWIKPAAMLFKPYTIAEILETVKKVLLGADKAVDSFQLPQIKDDNIPLAGEPIFTLARPKINQPSRILVVDDDEHTRKFSHDMLAASGYEVEDAKDGAAGWDALQTYEYDLVITDNKMPRMTGLEMIGKLRSANIGVPVIMATGLLPMDEFARKPWLIPDAMLERPFSDHELLTSVKNILGDNGL